MGNQCCQSSNVQTEDKNTINSHSSEQKEKLKEKIDHKKNSSNNNSYDQTNDQNEDKKPVKPLQQQIDDSPRFNGNTTCQSNSNKFQENSAQPIAQPKRINETEIKPIVTSNGQVYKGINQTPARKSIHALQNLIQIEDIKDKAADTEVTFANNSKQSPSSDAIAISNGKLEKSPDSVKPSNQQQDNNNKNADKNEPNKSTQKIEKNDKPSEKHNSQQKKDQADNKKEIAQQQNKESDKEKVKKAGQEITKNQDKELQKSQDKEHAANNKEKEKDKDKSDNKDADKAKDQQNNDGEYLVDPGNFVHLKKGNISQFYKIGEILGEGAFGQVCKVTHKATNIVNAMKTIKKSALIKEDQEKLFSELNILKGLDHPNIIKLFEIFQDSKNYYLITEYCNGGELFDKIKSLTHFTEKMAADYMKQILSAVVYCHQNQIVHRDLKPENLLFDSDKKTANIKVIDFGTSRKFDKGKKMTKRLGTPYYIAPEVLEQNYDEKCDVWSCGVILYILLCGYPPFGGRTEDEILKKVKSGKFKFDPEDWDKISADAKNLIKKMLTLDNKKRIKAEEALADPWIQKNAPQTVLPNKALANLSQFYTRNKLKQAILTFIVTQVSSQAEKEELLKSFRALDKNGDGTLSKEELIEGYGQVYQDKEKAIQQVNKILDQVDSNKSNKVDYSEFLTAAMGKELLLSKTKMEQAFKIFDQDGNGFITKNELELIIGDLDEKLWKEILKECDANKDGQISQNEFIDLLLKSRI